MKIFKKWIAKATLSGPIPPSSSRRPYFWPVGSSCIMMMMNNGDENANLYFDLLRSLRPSLSDARQMILNVAWLRNFKCQLICYVPRPLHLNFITHKETQTAWIKTKAAVQTYESQRIWNENGRGEIIDVSMAISIKIYCFHWSYTYFTFH